MWELLQKPSLLLSDNWPGNILPASENVKSKVVSACNPYVPRNAFLALILGCVLTGCSLSPTAYTYAVAQRAGFEAEQFEVQGFPLTVFRNPASSLRPVSTQTTLHVYLEGDGSPWIRNRYIASDPTSRNPIALKLMAQDPAPSLYLGRPCYLGTFANEACSPQLWTMARYGDRVLSSMEAALRLLLARHPAQNIVLIGYSGGGTLALLLANRISEVNTVITVAGNLDTDAWTRHHGYLPLTDSINPARVESWRSNLQQIHFFGEEDENVPDHITREFLRDTPLAQGRMLKGFDHSCCWVERWPEILKDLELL